MTQIQKHTAKATRESVLRVGIYICCVCVCVFAKEREKRRFVQYHKSQAIQLKTRYKKSVEVQINGEEVGGVELNHTSHADRFQKLSSIEDD